MTDFVVEIKTSDLFQKKGKTFDWSSRILDQEILVNRINDANKDILNPNAIEITHLAEEIKEFCEQHIASIVFFEHALMKLNKLGVTLT